MSRVEAVERGWHTAKRGAVSKPLPRKKGGLASLQNRAQALSCHARLLRCGCTEAAHVHLHKLRANVSIHRVVPDEMGGFLAFAREGALVLLGFADEELGEIQGGRDGCWGMHDGLVRRAVRIHSQLKDVLLRVPLDAIEGVLL
eukprot:scaffold7075_cov274-Pinguiococcus_pyrenoidosus.AAC.15